MTADRMVRVSVRILEKEYQVACLPEERSELLDSAEFLNGKMKDIRDAGNIVGLDRIAVMAALNLAHELLKRNRNEAIESEVTERVRQMRERVESALSRGTQLPL
jgi:cell division protein ZapA